MNNSQHPALTNRRTFLKTAGLTAALGLGGTGLIFGSDTEKKKIISWEKSGSLTPEEFRKRLEGPIMSIGTPFTSTFEVDYAGVRRMIQRGNEYGIPVVELTSGNSQYAVLSYEEIKELTRVTVEAAQGKALTIAATGAWWTNQVIDYAKYAESIGADGLQVLLPGKHAGEDSLVEHFRTIAGETSLPLVLHGNYSETLLEKLLKIESIVAMKEDLALTYYINRMVKFGDQLEIFSGGAKYRFLVGYPYGSRAFFSAHASFAPKVAMNFWKAIKDDDWPMATEIIKKYDHPWITYYIKNRTYSFWGGCLEYFGVAQRYVRPPQRSYSDQEMKQVKQFFDQRGLDPKEYQ